MFGSTHGRLSDRFTQRWVQATGRIVDLEADPWLDGPVGAPSGIGPAFFDDFARGRNLQVRRDGCPRGLMSDFATLARTDCDAALLRPEVADFYLRTSEYDLDAWSEWCGAFRPFGVLLARIFSRRLQQLNVPLSPLDTSRGITSEVLQLIDAGGQVAYTAWLRRLVRTGDVLYAGAYSVCRVSNFSGVCVKVAFPLPNGNALVIMRPDVLADGSLTLVSAGRCFGDPGFYFTVHGRDGRVWARYVRALRERIHVYPSGPEVHADHLLTIWGAVFLRLHYRLRARRPLAAAG